MKNSLKRCGAALGLVGVIGAVLAVAGANALVFTAPVNVTKLAGHQSEPTIAVNQANTQQLFATSNQLPTGVGAANSGRKSTDGGLTWTNTSMALPFGACCDYMAASDKFGNIFLSYIDTVTGPPSGANRVMLEISSDGGATWAAVASLPVAGVIDNLHGVDQPTVAVGGAPNPAQGSVWVTWNDGAGIQARGALVTGLGNGAVGAFVPKQLATSSNVVGGQFGDIAVGPTGVVVVTYQSGNGEGPGNVFVNADLDGLGAGGFGGQVLVAPTNVGKFDTIPAQANRQIDAEASLAYDRSGGVNNGRLYSLLTDETPDESSNTDVFVRTSDNNGSTWSAPVKVNDDATTNSQFFPTLRVDQTTGNVGVTFYDARADTVGAPIGPGNSNAAANDDTQYWGALSTNGGTSFGTNFKISQGNRPSNAAASGNPNEYGDYSWADYHANKLYMVWADNTNSTGDNPDGQLSAMEIYSARVDTTIPTGLAVTGVAARRSARDVVVTWHTVSETGIAGFNVYRSSGVATVKLNRGVIRADFAGRQNGAGYRFVDRTADRLVRYTYRVEIVAMDGRSSTAGVARIARR